MMNSPLKGIERISEELRLERQKANNALQDRARLRVEIEGLKQTVDQQVDEINQYRELYNNAHLENEQLKKQLHEEGGEQELMHEEMINLRQEMEVFNNTKQQLMDENEALLEKQKEKDTLIAAMQVKLESYETRTSSKDELINNMKNDIQQIRKQQLSAEQEKMELSSLLAQQTAINEELKAQLQMADVMETSYNQTKTSNEELRAELDKALQSNSELNEQARELNRTLSDRIQQVSLLEDTIEQLNISHQRMQQELGEVEAEKESILSRVQAEIDAGEAAREQADAAARGRDYLDKQVQDLRQAHEDALKYSSQLEEQLGATKSQLSECRGELSDCKEKLLECEGALEAAAGAQAMTTEIEILRAQLNDVRRQLIKRDLEEEAGVMAPSAVMDREQQGRIVYENIISELRGELDRANGKLHEVTRRYEEAQRNAARVEQLEEEVAMYKEMAKNVSRESQTAALSVSEATERSIRFAHEKHNLLHELHRTESELQTARAEITRCKEEIATTRSKMKTFHADKIDADKKVAIYLGNKSKLEAAMEELKQKYDLSVIEADKAKRTVHEQSFTISDLRLKLSEADKLKADNAALQRKLSNLKSGATNREKELLLSADSLKHQNSILQRELSAMKEKIDIHRQGSSQSHEEITKLRADVEALTSERDRYKRELHSKESHRAEQQLQELRRDLEQTVTEWKGIEKEKTVRDKKLAQVQAEYNKEREKVALLKVQLGLVEERLQVATQELSVYRGIDVYHSSMQVQLETYRKDRAGSQPSSPLKEDHPRAVRPQDSSSSNRRQDNRSSSRDSRSNGGPPPPPTREDTDAAAEAELKAFPSRDDSSPFQDAGRFSMDEMMPSAGSSRSSTPAPPGSRPGSTSLSPDTPLNPAMAGQYLAPEYLPSPPKTQPPQQQQQQQHQEYGYDDSGVENNDRHGAGDEAVYRGRMENRSSAAQAEADREELLRRRAERKALRDQQLRERVMQEERSRSGSSSSAQRGTSAAATAATARPDSSRLDAVDNTRLARSWTAPRPAPSTAAASVSASSVSRSSSRLGVENTSMRPQRSSSIDRTPSHQRVDASARGSAVSNLYNNSGRYSGARNQPQQQQQQQDAGAGTASASRNYSAFRPAKTDYERARRLLSM